MIEEAVFGEEVQHLADNKVGTKLNPVVFYGSSSIRLWDSLDSDFPEQEILNLAFGGSTIEYCSHYFEKLIEPNNLKKMIFYCGDNDIGNGNSPYQVLEDFKKIFFKFRRKFANKHFTFISIKPSIERFGLIGNIKEANALINNFLAEEPFTTYINVFDYMLNESGQVRKELFSDDLLHMNEKGYALWKELLSPYEPEIF